MPNDEFLLRDALGLELQIRRHCAVLKLDCADEYQVQQFAREMLQNMEQLKAAVSKGDRGAKTKVELFGMTLMMHQANTKAFGPDYLLHMGALSREETAWVAIAKALWAELEARSLDEK